MRLPLLAVAVASLAAVPAAPARAQTAAPAAAAAPADPAADRAGALAAVKRLFDAMRAGDSARARAVFHPSAQLASAMVREGRPEVRLDSVSAFLRAVGTPHAEVWDERLRDTAVQVDGGLASVWTGYAFYRGTQFSHCGVDAFHMVRTAAGWQILSLVDTRQRTGCPEQRAAGR